MDENYDNREANHSEDAVHNSTSSNSLHAAVLLLVDLKMVPGKSKSTRIEQSQGRKAS